MIVKIICQHSHKTIQTIYYHCDDCDDRSLIVTNIWYTIKNIIKKYQHDDIIVQDVINEMIYQSFCTQNTYDYCDFYVILDICDLYISFKAYTNSNHEFYQQIYVIPTKHIGNCVDDFLTRGVKSRLMIINKLIQDIESRADIRSSTTDYHNTTCYEHDFSSIVQIRNCAQKLLDNCNLHLERTSDHYTK